MKIHIDTIMSKFEEVDRKYHLEFSQLDIKMKELARDKARLEELLTVREIDNAVLNESKRNLSEVIE